MTKEQILSMDAGREMDWLVAERVMGWQKGKPWGNGNGPWIIDGEESRAKSWETTPRFSTNIVNAWEVVTRMTQRFPDGSSHWWADLNVATLMRNEVRFWCRFYAVYPMMQPSALPNDNAPPMNLAEWYSFNEAPLAICRAALLATACTEPQTTAEPTTEQNSIQKEQPPNTTKR